MASIPRPVTFSDVDRLLGARPDKSEWAKLALWLHWRTRVFLAIACDETCLAGAWNATAVALDSADEFLLLVFPQLGPELILDQLHDN